jgi:hypothetical protein
LALGGPEIGSGGVNSSVWIAPAADFGLLGSAAVGDGSVKRFALGVLTPLCG